MNFIRRLKRESIYLLSQRFQICWISQDKIQNFSSLSLKLSRLATKHKDMGCEYQIKQVILAKEPQNESRRMSLSFQNLLSLFSKRSHFNAFWVKIEILSDHLYI